MQFNPFTRCRIEQPVITQDAVYGNQAVTWSTLTTTWCDILDELPSKDERLAQGLVIASVRCRIRLRYRTDITSAMRFVINRPTATTWNIIGGGAMVGDKDAVEFLIEKVST